MQRIDLNCDLGEHEPPALTAALCAVVQRVNVACGGFTLKHVNAFDGNILVNLRRSEKIVHSYVLIQRGPSTGASLSNNVFFHEPAAGDERGENLAVVSPAAVPGSLPKDFRGPALMGVRWGSSLRDSLVGWRRESKL